MTRRASLHTGRRAEVGAGSCQASSTLSPKWGAKSGCEAWNPRGRFFLQFAGSMTGKPGIAKVRAGLKRRSTLSGWQVAADFSTSASSMYPDQFAVSGQRGALKLAKRITATLQRADQIEGLAEGNGLSVDTLVFAPIRGRRSKAGFGGPLNAFEIMKAFIRSRCLLGVSLRRPAASEKRVAGIWAARVLIRRLRISANLATPPGSAA